MALSLDDRLLGEKVHNYCSSSDGEADGEDDDRDGLDDVDVDNDEKPPRQRQAAAPEEPAAPPEQPRNWTGSAANTGPKGVVADWRRFKQLEAESRADQAAERRALAARLAGTCRTAADDEREARLDAELEAAMADVVGAEDAAFMAEYRQRRLEEVRRALAQRKLFGQVAALDRGSFVRAVDGESADVKVVVHICDSLSASREPACVAVNAALDWLAERYPTVKFCRIAASQAAVSQRFVERGLPALVVYKAGEVTASFVALAKELGDACSPQELEAYLTEFGVLSEAMLSEGQTVSQLLASQRRQAGGSGGGGGGGSGDGDCCGNIRGPAADAAACGRGSSDSDSD